VADAPTVLCHGDSNTHGADGSTGRRHPRDVCRPWIVAGLLPGAVAQAR
jgi:hypothetical protein